MELQDDPRFIKGIEEFNNGLYFECHETLEEIWLEEHGEERKFYQGIIQIAAGYYKLEQGVPVGALKLWRMGIEKLQAYSPVYLGVNVDALVAAVSANLAALEKDQGQTASALGAPTIQLFC
jgi:predicted metal-dependent hydrolase